MTNIVDCIISGYNPSSHRLKFRQEVLERGVVVEVFNFEEVSLLEEESGGECYRWVWLRFHVDGDTLHLVDRGPCFTGDNLVHGRRVPTLDSESRSRCCTSTDSTTSRTW